MERDSNLLYSLSCKETWFHLSHCHWLLWSDFWYAAPPVADGLTSNDFETSVNCAAWCLSCSYSVLSLPDFTQIVLVLLVILDCCRWNLKFCLRGMLGKNQRQTLFELLDVLSHLCYEEQDPSLLDQLESRVNVVCEKLERDFPISVQVN